MIVPEYSYQYKYPSVFSDVKNEKSFLLSHCSEIEKDNNVPCFFYGNLQNSFVAAKCFSTLARTVGSHFALTPGQIARLKDPIVSVGNHQLRFEAFSSCNSVYTRVDVSSSGTDGEFLHSGCTNIDFNDKTIRAFNSVGRSEKLLMGIGRDKIQIISDKHNVVEKKVTLPDRWIKGLGNVQCYLSEMDLSSTLTKAQALQLFKSLPTSPVKGDYYFSKIGLAYTFSPVPKPGSIKVGGAHRLNLLRNLLLLIDGLNIYECGQGVAFVLDFKDIRMSFLFSDSIYRGFSGEGKNLENMTTEISQDWILAMNSFFKTNEAFNPSLISIENDIDFKTMDHLQSSLSGIGLLGFDLFENQYFYRRLPFKLDRLMRFNPRLKNAKKLIENNEVVILERSATGFKAEVKGTADVRHTIIKAGDEYKCTCNLYTNNEKNRGLCKHILAVKILENNLDFRAF